MPRSQVNERRRLARDLPRVWNAPTTTDRDRKELLRTLVRDVIVTVHAAERRADVELCWEGGARTELSVRLNVRGPERRRLPDDTVELIRRLAAHHPDQQIAAILARNGHRTGTGLAFTAARVRAARQRAGIPAAPAPDPTSELVTISQAASEFGVSLFTIRTAACVMAAARFAAGSHARPERCRQAPGRRPTPGRRGRRVAA